MRLWGILGGLLLAAPAAAETPLWSDMAELDLEAAYRLIAEDYPGSAPSRGDTAFIETLKTAHDAARREAAAAHSYADYRSMLRRFAAAFGDIHISSRAVLRSDLRWPGFLVALVDDEWRVLLHDLDGGPPAGSLLVGCDGLSATELAEHRLAPYTTGWYSAAQRKLRSVNLFGADSELALDTPETCEFQTQDGESISHDLSWSPISRDDFNAAATAARPVAGEDVRLDAWHDGWWIRLGTLTGDAHALGAEILERREEIASSPYVVIDMRGNTGGSESPARDIANALFGSQAVDAARAEGFSEDAKVYWRVSESNLARLREYVDYFGELRGADSEDVAEWRRHVAAMEAALARGDEFSRPDDVGEDSESDQGEAVIPAPANVPDVYVITDNVCFSSCISSMRFLLNLDLTHVGQPTRAGVHYFENRSLVLPSGLSTFATMQAYGDGIPRDMGPFDPEVPVRDAVIMDEAALKDVVARLAGAID